MYTMCRIYMRKGIPQSNLNKMTKRMNNVPIEKKFNGFTSYYTNYPKRCGITKKLYGTLYFYSNITHNKTADFSKYDSHLLLQFN